MTSNAVCFELQGLESESIQGRRQTKSDCTLFEEFVNYTELFCKYRTEFSVIA